MIPRHICMVLLALVAVVAICDADPEPWKKENPKLGWRKPRPRPRKYKYDSDSSSDDYGSDSSSDRYRKHYRGRGYRAPPASGGGGQAGIFASILGLFNGGGGGYGGGYGGRYGHSSYRDSYYDSSSDCSDSDEVCEEGEELWCWRCHNADNDEECFDESQPGWEKCYAGDNSVCIYEYHTNRNGEVCKVSRGCKNRDECYYERKKNRRDWKVECHVDGEGAACCTPPEWGPWTSWSTCKKTCGPEYSVRTRNCGPTDCPVREECDGCDIEKRDCENPCCPTLGTWTSWTSWDCIDSCGPTVQSRNRTCEKHPDIYDFCDDFYCPGDDSQEIECFNGCCPDPDVPSSWSSWECHESCGETVEYRNRTCDLDDPWFVEECCGPLTEERECFNGCCEDPDVPGPWSEWECVDNCGETVEFRNRTCDLDDPWFVEECCGPLSEERECYNGCCEGPDNPGKWSDWDPWQCRDSCGWTVEWRNRTCLPDQSQGRVYGDCPPYCPGEDSEHRACDLDCCPNTGTWGLWTSWDCEGSCGITYESRNRTCLTDPDDENCCEGDSSERVQCDAGCCESPDGYWGPFGDWGPCDSNCERHATRECKYPDPHCPGEPCVGEHTETDTSDHCQYGVDDCTY